MIEEKYETISPFFKKPVGYLRINNSFSISVYDKMPSRFHRWMAKVLLGWKYEDVEDGDEK